MSMLNEEMKVEADRLYGKYRKHINLLESSLLAKTRSITPYDVYVLGKQLESFDFYVKLCETNGNAGQLGTIPSIGLDVISVSYGTSIMPAIASVQTIDEAQGYIYMKNVTGQATRGNITKGDVIRDPRNIGKTPQGYASNQMRNENCGAIASQAETAAVEVAGNLSVAPVMPQSIHMSLRDASAEQFATDIKTGDIEGKIVGMGITGTINYETGAFKVKVTGAVAADTELIASYRTNFEITDDIPTIQTDYQTKQVQAQVFALKTTMGMLQSFTMKKRFGLIAEDEAARDLIGAVNSEIGGEAVRTLAAISPDANDPIKFDRVPKAGVSAFEHKQTFKDVLALADQRINSRAGRGMASSYVAGSVACSLIQTLPGFKLLTDGTTVGPHIFGTIDGKTVVRVPEEATLPSNQVVASWKSQSPFEASLVVASYMPLVITSTLPNGMNPLQSQRAAAVWAAIEGLCENFVTTIEIDNATVIG